MPALGAHCNVSNTCLVILAEKGFRTWTDEDGDYFYAEKDGWDFMANDPIQLLGLITIYERTGPDKFKEYWWRIREPWLVEDLPKEAPDYTPIWKKTK